MAEQRPSSEDVALARRARNLGLIIAGAMVLWMGAQVIGGQIGLAARYAFLIDLIAIAVFIWALFGVWQIWRKRHTG